jgi:hypothetical protein
MSGRAIDYGYGLAVDRLVKIDDGVYVAMDLFHGGVVRAKDGERARRLVEYPRLMVVSQGSQGLGERRKH